MADSTAWNAYYDNFKAEPKDASQLQSYAKKQKDLPDLNFKQANEIFKAYKGKGRIGDSKEPESGGASGDSGAVNPLFAALNKGGDVTKGLKKVTRDMTNKDKKISGKITETKQSNKKEPAAPKKPPAIRKQGFRIWVENYVEGVEEIKDASIKNEVYICNCENSGFSIPNKVKTVIIDNCKKIKVEIGEVLTSVDMINAKGCTLFLKKNAPTVNIDKCEGPRVVLFQELLDKQPQIITSMTSDMNISVPGKTENDDWKDVPIPYQFTTTIDPNTKEVTTVPLSHMG